MRVLMLAQLAGQHIHVHHDVQPARMHSVMHAITPIQLGLVAAPITCHALLQTLANFWPLVIGVDGVLGGGALVWLGVINSE